MVSPRGGSPASLTASGDDVFPSGSQTKRRYKKFHDANISEVIDITVATITTPVGTKVPEMVLSVVSTPRRGVNHL